MGRGSGADGMGAHNQGHDCKFLQNSCWSFKRGPAAEKVKQVANVLVFANDWGTRRRAIRIRPPPLSLAEPRQILRLFGAALPSPQNIWCLLLPRQTGSCGAWQQSFFLEIAPGALASSNTGLASTGNHRLQFILVK